MKFFHDLNEKKNFIDLTNKANSQRLKIFAPLMAVFMAYEFIKDFAKISVKKDSVFSIQALDFQINSYKIFVILEIVMILSSIAIFIINIYYKKKASEKFNNYFDKAVSLYTFILLLCSSISVIVETSTFHSADFNFFYYITIVATSILYLNPFFLVPGILFFNLLLWFLITEFNWATGFSPYKPYCVFILITLCFTSIFRSRYILHFLRREEKIKGYKEAAEKENQLKSLFLANMSHEIRTPMNAIIGMSELALDFDIEDSKKNTIRQIRSSGIALLNIINDILDFSKIESGKMDIVPADYDLLKMVYDAANVAKVKLEGKDVELIIEIDPTLNAFYNGDDLRIRQILINLVGNAAKFTEKGFVIIRVEQLNRYETREGLRFSVIDTGCGIKESDLKNLFEAFRQVDMKMNRTKGGTGLGLSISKRLVQLMDGDIGVKSEYGKGSCFYFNLPQESVSEKTCAEVYKQIFDTALTNEYHSELKNLPLEKLLNKNEFASLFAEKTGSFNFICPKAKILVVDDNEVNIQVAQGLLKKFGVVPEVAFSGFEALEKCETNDFDLIYMDHQMPVMDGIETLKKLREKELNSNRHSIVLALSANAINGAKEMFLENGFDDFIAKPVQGKDFGESLKKWLNANLIEENSTAETNDSIPASFPIPDSSKIDINSAINQTGSFENWLKTTKTFDSLIEKKSDLIEEYLAKKDYKNYTIEVHALKSSARIIGANELSEKAKELESLGNEIQSLPENSGSTDLIEENIQEKSVKMLTLYRSYKEVLKDVRNFGEKSDNEKTTVSEDELKETIEAIKKAAAENDLFETEESFNKLKNSILPKNLQEIMPKLSEAVENIDFEEILKLL